MKEGKEAGGPAPALRSEVMPGIQAREGGQSVERRLPVGAGVDFQLHVPHIGRIGNVHFPDFGFPDPAVAEFRPFTVVEFVDLLDHQNPNEIEWNGLHKLDGWLVERPVLFVAGRIATYAARLEANSLSSSRVARRQ
nr:MAG TPA: hypothetical protein [Caudoviricetes sp.]